MVSLFKGNSKVQFIDSKSVGIRSKDLISSWFKNGEAPKEMLAKMPASFDWKQANAYIETYQKNIELFLRDDFDSQTSKVLAKVLPASLADLLMDDGEIKEWLIFQDMQKQSMLGILAIKIQSSDYFEGLPSNVRDHLSTHLYSAFAHPSVIERYRRNQHMLNLYSLRTASATKKVSKLRQTTSRILSQMNGQIFRFYKKHLVTRLKGVALTGDIAKDFGVGPQLATVNPEQLSGVKTVTVYRGVPYSEHLESYLKNWKENGMLSKTALKSFLESGDLDAAILQSQNELDFVGQRAAVLHHIFGDWKTSTPLISTSLDPNVARDFAGPNGLLLTLEIPIQDGYFLNDLKYWKGTPWEKDGNPASKQLEFAVANQIKPEWIKAVDTQGVVPVQTTIGLSLGWRIKTTFKMMKYKRQLKASANSCLQFYSSLSSIQSRP